MPAKECRLETPINFSDVYPVGKWGAVAKATFECTEEELDACQRALGSVACSMPQGQFRAHKSNSADLQKAVREALEDESISARLISIELSDMRQPQEISFTVLGSSEE